jgi:hypothetical protein
MARTRRRASAPARRSGQQRSSDEWGVGKRKSATPSRCELTPPFLGGFAEYVPKSSPFIPEGLTDLRQRPLRRRPPSVQGFSALDRAEVWSRELPKCSVRGSPRDHGDRRCPGAAHRRAGWATPTSLTAAGQPGQRCSNFWATPHGARGGPRLRACAEH